MLATPQALATWELTKYSQYGGAFSGSAFPFPFKFKHLITFLVPFSFGDPSKMAPYLQFNPQELTWEISIYPGLICAFAVIIGILSFRVKGRTTLSWLAMSTVLTLMGATGISAYLPLINRFRVPGRFLIFALFFLCLVGAVVIDQFATEIEEKAPSLNWGKYKIPLSALMGPLILLLTIGSYIDLRLAFQKYNATLSEEVWLMNNETALFLQKELGEEERYTSLRPGDVYNTIYASQRGWQANPEEYLQYEKTLPPNSGLTYQTAGASVYTGARLNKATVINTYLHGGFVLGEDLVYRVAPAAKPLLSLSGVRYVVSPWEIRDEDFVLSKEIPLGLKEMATLKIYEYQKHLPKYFLAKKMERVSSEQESQQMVAFGNYQPTEVVFSEAPSESSEYSGKGNLQIVEQRDGFFKWEIESNEEQLLFVSENYYPGWEAEVDGVKVPIIPANYAFMALEVPPLTKTVTLKYQPTYLPQAYYLSLGTLLFCLLLLLRVRRGKE